MFDIFPRHFFKLQVYITVLYNNILDSGLLYILQIIVSAITENFNSTKVNLYNFNDMSSDRISQCLIFFQDIFLNCRFI